ncbi:hypothetical protein BH24ACT6_BH24ACT6_07850 [soil metagenome]
MLRCARGSVRRKDNGWSYRVVVSPMGESMAIGDEVYGGGGYFYVADVEQIAGPQASSLAADCADNTYGEIAVVNNWEPAIGPAQP